MAAKSGAANAPNKAIDVDLESPANKRPGPSHNNPEGTPLTLELFQPTIQPLIAKIGNIDTRVGQVETGNCIHGAHARTGEPPHGHHEHTKPAYN